MTPRHEDPDLVVVRWATDEFGGGVLASTLESEGISARVVTDDPMGTTGFFGATSARRVAVLVRTQDAERADALLRDAAHAGEGPEGFDWADVDLGEPQDEIARRIASGEHGRNRGWWWGGWPASVILLIAGFIGLGFSSTAALILWLAALIACVGSTMSWTAWRLRLGSARADGKTGKD